MKPKSPSKKTPGTQTGFGIIDTHGLQRTLPSDPAKAEHMKAAILRKLKAATAQTHHKKPPKSISKKTVIRILLHSGFRLIDYSNLYYHPEFGRIALPEGRTVEIAHDPTFKRLINRRPHIFRELTK